MGECPKMMTSLLLTTTAACPVTARGGAGAEPKVAFDAPVTNDQLRRNGKERSDQARVAWCV
jgi:hypothetical protein